MIQRNSYENKSQFRIGIIQSRAARNILESRESVLREYGLSSPEWFVLGYVASETATGGTRVGDIATTLDVQSTYVTSILRKLEAKDLARAQTDDEDRRARLITVTKKGAVVAKAIERELIKQNAIWLGQASPTTVQHYLAVLDMLARGYPKT